VTVGQKVWSSVCLCRDVDKTKRITFRKRVHLAFLVSGVATNIGQLRKLLTALGHGCETKSLVATAFGQSIGFCPNILLSAFCPKSIGVPKEFNRTQFIIFAGVELFADIR